MLRAATRDPVIAAAFGEVIGRDRSPMRLLDPQITWRLLFHHGADQPTALSRYVVPTTNMRA
jgi:hypothetical protein